MGLRFHIYRRLIACSNFNIEGLTQRIYPMLNVVIYVLCIYLCIKEKIENWESEQWEPGLWASWEVLLILLVNPADILSDYSSTKYFLSFIDTHTNTGICQVFYSLCSLWRPMGLVFITVISTNEHDCYARTIRQIHRKLFHITPNMHIVR